MYISGLPTDSTIQREILIKNLETTLQQMKETSNMLAAQNKEMAEKIDR